MQEKHTNYMKVKEKFYRLLKSGEKTVELRLNDEKRQAIQVGDDICFSNADSPSECFDATVTGLYRASNFEELCTKIPPQSAGFSDTKELVFEMQRFYSLDQQRKYGVVGIEIKRTKIL